MKNKKGIAHVGAIIAIVAILGATAAAGYVMYQKQNTPSVSVDSDGVQVKTDGLNVQTGEDGVSVDMDGLNVQTGENGVSVQMDNGTNINVDDDNVSLNTGTSTSAQVQQGGATEAKTNTVLIFDASGSMAQQADGDSRINIAKEAVDSYISELGDDINLSVVAYGHKGNNTQAGKAASCNGIEEIYYMGPVNDQIVAAKVGKLNPNGWTPITDSLKKAENILQKSATTGQKHVVLLSDGEETCGGDPVVMAKELCSKGIVVDVIGFDVDGNAERQLKQISINGCGEYYSANNANEFSAVVDDLGVKLNTGNIQMNVNDNEVRLQSDGLDMQVDDDGATMDMGNMHVDTKGDMPVVDIPGASIPSF